MKIAIKDIYAKASVRPQGYVEDVLSKGVIQNEYLLIEPETYTELVAKYSQFNKKAPVKGCCGR